MASRLIGKADVLNAIRDVETRQLPFVVSLGLNRTAERIKGDVERTLPQRLDRPTPFTQRGLAIRPALKSRPVAWVFFKDRQASYLKAQEVGGQRTPNKRRLVVPSRVRLNRYGNMTRGKVKALLKRKDVFSAEINGVEGIWQRRKRSGPKLLVRYTKKAEYRPRLGFAETARTSFNRHVFERFRSAAQFAIRTSRRPINPRA